MVKNLGVSAAVPNSERDATLEYVRSATGTKFKRSGQYLSALVFDILGVVHEVWNTA